jgi:hypothetical protein
MHSVDREEYSELVRSLGSTDAVDSHAEQGPALPMTMGLVVHKALEPEDNDTGSAAVF